MTTTVSATSRTANRVTGSAVTPAPAVVNAANAHQPSSLIDPSELPAYRALARTLACELLADPSVVLLDTETTTLWGQVIEVGVLSADGQVLLDTLVRPGEPIPADATAVHGLRLEDLRDAPQLHEVAGELRTVLHGRRVVAYNCHYDRAVLAAEEHRIARPLNTAASWDCAMDLYAAWNGELLADRTRFRNKRLPGAGHRALDDCRSMLTLLRLMASCV
ncbi:hypothetical protein GCM10027586_09250 [Kineococcus gypseus]|uniref:3'-5' exonuclease n=1 Tax=Kineococcus gypseus TaxID=1637102 RepID=UPI003D7ED7F5